MTIWLEIFKTYVSISLLEDCTTLVQFKAYQHMLELFGGSGNVGKVQEF